MRRTWFLWAVIGLSSGCSLDAGSRGPFGPEDPETAVQKTKLPDKIPAPHVFQFTGDETAGHHKPKMAGAVADAGVKRATNEGAVLTSARLQRYEELPRETVGLPLCWANAGHSSTQIGCRRRARSRSAVAATCPV